MDEPADPASRERAPDAAPVRVFGVCMDGETGFASTVVSHVLQGSAQAGGTAWSECITAASPMEARPGTAADLVTHRTVRREQLPMEDRGTRDNAPDERRACADRPRDHRGTAPAADCLRRYVPAMVWAANARATRLLAVRPVYRGRGPGAASDPPPPPRWVAVLALHERAAGGWNMRASLNLDLERGDAGREYRLDYSPAVRLRWTQSARAERTEGLLAVLTLPHGDFAVYLEGERLALRRVREQGEARAHRASGMEATCAGVHDRAGVSFGTVSVDGPVVKTESGGEAPSLFTVFPDPWHLQGEGRVRVRISTGRGRSALRTVGVCDVRAPAIYGAGLFGAGLAASPAGGAVAQAGGYEAVRAQLDAPAPLWFLLVVAAPFATAPVPGAGAVFVFAACGFPMRVLPVQTLTKPGHDGASMGGDAPLGVSAFGSRVSLSPSGEWLAVVAHCGARFPDGRGQAYVYRWEPRPGRFMLQRSIEHAGRLSGSDDYQGQAADPSIAVDNAGHVVMGFALGTAMFPRTD